MLLQEDPYPRTCSTTLTELAHELQHESRWIHRRIRALGVTGIIVAISIFSMLLSYPDLLLLTVFTIVSLFLTLSLVFLYQKQRQQVHDHLVYFISGGRREALIHQVESSLNHVTGIDLVALILLNRSLENRYWWESSREKRVRFQSAATLNGVLVGIGAPQLMLLSAEDRAYLRRELTRWLGSATGWYLDIEFPIRLYLALALLKERGMEGHALRTLDRENPRLREAAEEYLKAVR